MARVPQKDREAVHALVTPSTRLFLDVFTEHYSVSQTGTVEALLLDLSDAMDDESGHVDQIVERARRIDNERRKRARSKQRA